MSKEVNILVACGSGVATSTVAQEKVKVILKDAHVPAKITKSTLSEIPSKQNDVDLILTTSKYNKPLNKPVISVFGLISGINQENIKKQIVDECNKILGK
ncbi:MULTISPECIES: PTS sugar transporter subunit IIB [Tissierellales]|jgi:PTS system galactitol-specific IIB component|uniref:PTS galactitol transporter subunit IIB n=1 Tax=Acidilutibacter cellobiosedens TaxID=2507161 RepID=A0A410Q898_9FIRM|nr:MULTISPECIES: PTS sugar transporter subunit IIB [Tissierellales]MBE6083293.1 PTS galactitol transporter subunit IIB [Tissierellaceae bacterium]QAT60193.1 PTS galactitol transporter subunit IIB [Acidilutibacter cellobiosedens]SCL92572.1 Galactitol-specific phosphotransferase enzyme IIB component [Sporanaerobacter sp. PP17-6a]